MTIDDALAVVLKALNAIGVPYMITGSLASNAYGISRSTKDADFVLQTGNFDFARLHALLGSGLHLDPQMSFEGVTFTRRYIIEKTVGEPFKFELFLLSEDDYDRARFDRRLAAKMLGEPVWLPTAEDVIITKLRWSKQGRRTKDTDDVRNVIAVQADRLDWKYIHHWCDEHGTRALLEEVQRSIPPLGP